MPGLAEVTARARKHTSARLPSRPNATQNQVVKITVSVLFRSTLVLNRGGSARMGAWRARTKHKKARDQARRAGALTAGTRRVACRLTGVRRPTLLSRRAQAQRHSDTADACAARRPALWRCPACCLSRRSWCAPDQTASAPISLRCAWSSSSVGVTDTEAPAPRDTDAPASADMRATRGAARKASARRPVPRGEWSPRRVPEYAVLMSK